MGEERTSKVVAWAAPDVKKRGRPRRRWMDAMIQGIEETQIKNRNLDIMLLIVDALISNKIRKFEFSEILSMSATLLSYHRAPYRISDI